MDREKAIVIVQDAILKTTFTPADEYTLESYLGPKRGLELDSLDVIKVAMEIEDVLDKVVPDELLQHVQTVNDLVKLVEKL